MFAKEQHLTNGRWLITPYQRSLTDYTLPTVADWLHLTNGRWLITPYQRSLTDYTLPTVADWLHLTNGRWLITPYQRSLTDYTLPTVADWLHLTNGRWLPYLSIEVMSAVVVNILLEINCLLWQHETAYEVDLAIEFGKQTVAVLA